MWMYSVLCTLLHISARNSGSPGTNTNLTPIHHHFQSPFCSKPRVRGTRATCSKREGSGSLAKGWKRAERGVQPAATAARGSQGPPEELSTKKGKDPPTILQGAVGSGIPGACNGSHTGYHRLHSLQPAACTEHIQLHLPKSYFCALTEFSSH